jgi:universal stress protein E
MNQLKSIVAGVDFSPCSRMALQQAVRVAQWNQARLHVVHVIEHLVISDLADALGHTLPQIQTDAVRLAREQLETWLTAAGSRLPHRVEVVVAPPIEGLLRQVQSVAADLVVLGVRGDALFPSGAGTLATKCLRKAPTKVLLVHELQSLPFRRVLACVDFSPTSREAVKQALCVAAQDQSQVCFLHVFQGPWHRLHYRAFTSEAAPEFQRHYRLLLEQRLKDFVGDTAGLDARFTVYDATGHGCGIAEYARHMQADLVVLGTKGRTNLGYVLLGSTVERLLRELPCSALTVRAAKAEPVSLTATPAPNPT